MDPRELKPTYCVWELTLACNLRCGHCGSKAGKPRPDEMSTKECLGVVDSLGRLGCEVITLSGGEPTLRDDWHEIAAAIRDHGMIPNMVTNGIALDESQAQRIKDAKLANVAVSIDGPEEIHDQVRGKGTFKKTSRAVRVLKDAGISTTIMSTINTLNLRRLEETYQVAVDLGADAWRTQLGKPMGNMTDEMVIKPKDLLTVLPTLYDLSQRGEARVGIGDSLGYYGPYDSQLRAKSWKGGAQRWTGCQAGLRAIGVEANGGIKGCLSMQAFGQGPDPFLEGNLRERSLEEIWLDPKAFAYNRSFCEEDLSGYCRRCRHRLACRGGAKCVAAATMGQVGEDPYCYFRVASLAMRWPAIVSKAQVATAAGVLSLFMAGCGPLPGPKDPVTVLDYGVEPPPNCEQVCCECDYGVLPEEVYAECCEPVAQPEYGVTPDPINCETVCCECEYGILPEEVRAECCEPVAQPDYGVTPDPINCEEVCCECDYGVLPEEVRAACCEPVVTPDYGAEPDPTPVECLPVCCDCDYGVVPPECEEVYAQICDPVVTPDYGAEPDPVPIDCTDVCCECDYGILPEEVRAECCDPVITPDYGVDPKPDPVP